MNSGFLSICNKIDYKSPDNIRASLELSHYIYSTVENKYFCCIEGVNQFSVKASYVFSQDTTKRILPAQIEYLEIDEQLLPLFEPIDLVANIIKIGGFFKITGELYNQTGLKIGVFVIKTAAIDFVPITELSEVNSGDFFSTKLTEELRSLDTSDENFLGTFEFLSSSYLAQEHFPGVSVFPASQSIAVIFRFVNSWKPLHVLSWHKFSFISPVFSGGHYSVHIHPSPDKNNYRIQIKNRDLVCVNGFLKV